MARVKRGVTAHAKHKKVLKLAKGYVGRSGTNFRPALERVEKALQYAYRDRRNRKRTSGALWIQPSTPPCGSTGRMTYSASMACITARAWRFDRK
jgi:large subunit ribosomal protein L20